LALTACVFVANIVCHLTMASFTHIGNFIVYLSSIVYIFTFLARASMPSSIELYNLFPIVFGKLQTLLELFFVSMLIFALETSTSLMSYYN